MSGDAPARTLSRFWQAALIGLVGTVAGLGAPGLLAASQRIVCDDPLLVADPAQASAQLGWALAVDQDENQKWLAGGANQDNAKAGSVSMYLNPAPGAPQTGPKIIPGDLRVGDGFGSSVSISGGWLAVGAPIGDGRVRDSGVVYLFQREGMTWVLKAKLEAMDATRGDQFGFSISLSNGTTLAVGAPGDSDRGSRSGSSYVFELQGGVWKQTAKLLVADGRPFDEFGSSVALSGDRLVVGAPFADNLQVFRNFGAAYVFTRDGSNGWILRSPDKDKLTADVTFRGDNILFGASVAIQGNRIVVGAPGDDLQNRLNSGSAYVFELQETDWIRQPVLTPAGPGTGEQFGNAVQTDGDRLVIGARFDSESVREAGAAYLFQKNGGTWQQKQKLRNQSPQQGAAFGQSVAILGEEVFLGGFRYDVGAVSDAGAITVCKPGRTPPTADLATLVKTDGNEIVDPGQVLIYTITFKNNGPIDVTGARIIDSIPSALTDVHGLPLTIDLRAKKKRTFRVTAKVHQDARGTFTNKVCISPPDGIMDEIGGNNCKDDTNRIRPESPEQPIDLVLEKSDAPDPVGMGEILTYTLTITNKGPDTATGVTLDETVPADLIPMGRDCSGSSGSSCPLDTLGPGEHVTITLKFKVPECYSGPSTVVNTARVRADQRELSPSDNSDTEETRIVDRKVADLVVEKTGPDSVECGDPMEYILEVRNLGPDFACGVVLKDPVPAELTSPVIPAGCGLTANEILCSIRELPPGPPQIFRVSFTVPESAEDESKIVNTATVTADTADPISSNNSAMTMTTIDCPDPGCDLSIAKTDSLETAESGQTLLYVLTARNPGTAGRNATVSDDFPPELTSVRWCRDTDSPCTPDREGNLLDTIFLPPGGTATYRAQGTVAAMFTGTLTNTATVTGPPGCVDANPSDNTATDVTEVVLPPGVTVLCKDISGKNLEGETMTFTFVLMNGGPNVQMDNPGDEFTDILPAGLTLVSAGASSGVAMTSGNTATWNGSIPVGGMVTITVTATIDLGTAGTTICNPASIAFDADGNGTNESSATSDACCFPVLPTSAIPGLSVSGLVALALLLAVFALARLRRRAAP